MTDHEQFVDAGAFTGDSAKDFLRTTGSKFDKIYLFELDKQSFDLLNIEVGCFGLTPEEISRVLVFNKGLYSKRSKIRYTCNTTDSRISEKGDQEGDVIDLDSELNGERVSYIKMDIEGTEMEALKGAQETIRKYKPKLAICLYHKPEDLHEVPLYLKKLVPEYKQYMRHYSPLEYETVLYAVL
jgi:FkbM family methyltransferase